MAMSAFVMRMCQGAPAVSHSTSALASRNSHSLLAASRIISSSLPSALSLTSSSSSFSTFTHFTHFSPHAASSTSTNTAPASLTEQKASFSTENENSMQQKPKRVPLKYRHRDYVPPSIESGHKRAVSALVTKPYSAGQVRTGLIGIKLGMTAMWDQHGERHACTAIQLDECQVVQVKPEKDSRGLIGLQLGSSYRAKKKFTKALIGHFKLAGVPPKKKLVEFRVSPDAAVPAGFVFDARHFLAGQYVDVVGTSVGKGFAGAMKLHGFKGQGASHGVSAVHRSIGSVGAKGVGRVFPGKRMPGRMGGDRVTVQSLKVMKIDVERNIIIVHGAVPGPAGGYVRISDAVRKRFDEKSPPPFPTFVAPENEDRTGVFIEAPEPEINPFLKFPA